MPALVLSTCLGGGTALSLVISGLFQLPGSHFAHAPPMPLYPHFWFHVFEHVAVKTHFFDISQDRVAFRLLEFLGWEVIVVGFAAGLLVWGIASWVSRATRASLP